MKQYELFELVLQGEEPEGSFVKVDVAAEFTVNDEVITVKGFYAGNGTYKIRFYPKQAGNYHYVVKGIVQAKGNIVCEPANTSCHGMVLADGTHFRYEDGTWFYPFGTTVYALIHQEQALIDQTIETLVAAPFNKVRMCMFPKHYDFNQNDPDYYAFENIGEQQWNTHKPSFDYWDHLERWIRQLDDLGIQCDLILFHPYDCWGFAKLPVEDALTYLDYAVRRLSAFPNVWWSLANEYDLMDYEQEDWERFAHEIRKNDAYGHLLSNHQIFKPWDFNNPDTTHICHQTGKIDAISDEITKYQKPCMIDECSYEGNLPYSWGNISAFEMVNRFWKVVVQGGYCTHGEVYLSADDVLWWAKGGKLKGESPKRIAFLKDIIDSLPGPIKFAGKSFSVTSEDEFEAMKKNGIPGLPENSVIRAMLRLDWAQASEILNIFRVFMGRVGNEVYLIYYDRHCTAIGGLDLPEDQSYDVEVIDVWEMTRAKVLSGVSGKVQVDLPGKEGMALLARKAEF